MREDLDRACFEILAAADALIERMRWRASRHMCSRGAHDEEYVATAVRANGWAWDLIACRREGCTWSRSDEYLTQPQHG